MLRLTPGEDVEDANAAASSLLTRNIPSNKKPNNACASRPLLRDSILPVSIVTVRKHTDSMCHTLQSPTLFSTDPLAAALGVKLAFADNGWAAWITELAGGSGAEEANATITFSKRDGFAIRLTKNVASV